MRLKFPKLFYGRSQEEVQYIKRLALLWVGVIVAVIPFFLFVFPYLKRCVSSGGRLCLEAERKLSLHPPSVSISRIPQNVMTETSSATTSFALRSKQLFW